MIKKIKLFFKSEFAVALSTTSITTAVQMLAGLVVNKILAVTIGPSGIALMGQFTNFKELVTNLSNGSFGQGVTKYIADHEVENKKILATSNIITAVLSVTIGGVVMIFSSTFSEMLFKTTDFSFVFIIFGFTVPFFAFNNILIATVNGYRDYKTLAKLKITNSLIALIISGSLTWYFLVKGALIAQAINTSLIFFASLLIIFKSRKLYFFFDKSSFDKKVLKLLLAFTLMAITSTILKPIVQIIIRGYIMDNSGEFEAGIWEGTKRLSDYYTQIITIALGVYYLPRLSSLHTNTALKKEIYYGLKIIVPFIIGLGLLIFLLKDWIILILFSEDFVVISEYIYAQLIGDFFMITSFMIAYLMLAKVMVKLFVASQLIFAFTRLIFSMYFFNIAGVEGVIWANALNYFLYLLFVTIAFRKILFTKLN